MLRYYKPSDRVIGHWEERISLQGYPYWVWSKPMPRIFPPFVHCVFYIYPSELSAKENSEDGATGFFYGEKSEVSPNFPHLYAVANRHTVFADGVKEPVLRINTKDGGYMTYPTEQSDWKPHPESDIAICRIRLDISLYEIDFFERGIIIDDEFIRKFNVGAGDDVFMIGRFRKHAGTDKNLPIVMFGNIATMNEEPIYNRFINKKQESYLVEMRSMHGFSGSPVLLHIPNMSFRWTKIKDNEYNFVTAHSYKGLLGIQWGRIRYEEMAKDLDTGRDVLIELDSAMAGVVPVSKLMDLIDSEEMIEMRKNDDEEARKKNEESGVDLTSFKKPKLKKDEGITKEEFEDALRKIARPLKPDDPKKKET
jgi:hypothetical protein